MLKLLFVSSDKNSLSDLAMALKEYDDVELLTVESGETALSMISKSVVDLVITDEKLSDMTGLAFAEKIILLNPMINCVAISSLPPEEFHAASEGLGLMDQLPVQPGKEDAEKLLRTLRYIKGG